MRDIRNKRFLFLQQLKSDYWDWPTEVKQLLDNWEENKSEIFKYIYDCLSGLTEEKLVEFAIIVHDKDISYDENLVEPHVHGYVEFPRQVSLGRVAGALGLEREKIEVPSSKGGRANVRINALSYLIHAKDKHKYQYSVSDVETFGTLDYEAFVNEHKQDFKKFAATKSRKELDKGLDFTLNEIQTGKLDYSSVMKDDELAFLYANNQQKFREAFSFFGERQSFLRLEELRRGDYQLTVLYIQGESDAGKTTLASELSLQVKTKMNELGLREDIYSASAKNSFDNYLGEGILILDDLREDSLLPSDWLKLFDPLNSSKLSARYYNKLVVPRLIIIPVYKSPKTFFGKIKAEDLNQYLRRINFLLDVSFKNRTENIRFYNVSELVKREAVDFYQRENGTVVSLNFKYEDVFCSDDKEYFINRLLEEYVYPRILPKKEEEKDGKSGKDGKS